MRLIAGTVMMAAAVEAAAIGVQVEVLREFQDQPAGPANAIAELALGPDGAFYGVTGRGGVYNQGTVFRVTSGGLVTMLHSFQTDEDDGAVPKARLLLAPDGLFYGTTSDGGEARSRLGTVFRITPQGAYERLHSFTPEHEGVGGSGENPLAGLTVGSDGRLYGTTALGGGNGSGTVFTVSRSGEVSYLKSFGPGWDAGALPGPLTLHTDSALYGTASVGGPFLGGVIFRITTEGDYSLVHGFGGCHDNEEGPPAGDTPIGELLLGRDGMLYGTTAYGGAYGRGTVFRVNADGTVETLYSSGEIEGDGAEPRTPLTQLEDGTLLGVTVSGGQYHDFDPLAAESGGTVFALSVTGLYTQLHSFGETETEPQAFYGGLVPDGQGGFLGMSLYGGQRERGTVYRLTLTDEDNSARSFQSEPWVCIPEPKPPHPEESDSRSSTLLGFGIASPGALALMCLARLARRRPANKRNWRPGSG